jgi:hypothetical protein
VITERDQSKRLQTNLGITDVGDRFSRSGNTTVLPAAPYF